MRVSRAMGLALACALTGTVALSGCGSSNSEADASPTVASSPPAGFSVNPQYAEMCQAFNEIAGSPQAVVLNDDSASQTDLTSAMGAIGPQLSTFVKDYSAQMPANVASDFEQVVTEINAVAGLNDSSSVAEAGTAVRGLFALRSAGASVDSFTKSTCGTSLGF